MLVFRAGQPAKLTIPCKDGLSGAAITATAASYRVLDENDDELLAITPVPGFVASSASADITIAGADNALPAGAIRAARTVELLLTSATGTFLNITTYLLEGDQTVEVGVNSFVTLAQAEMLARELPDLTSWGAKSDVDKKASLVAAYHGLCRLRFTIPRSHNMNVVSYNPDDSWGFLYVTDIKLLDRAELEVLEPNFLQALRYAQVTEADVQMGGDPVNQLRRDGIISQTVGESSSFFGSKQPLDLSVSKRALNRLRGYISYSIPIARL